MAGTPQYVCINGDKYAVVPDGMALENGQLTSNTSQTDQLADLESLIQTLIDIQGGGNLPGLYHSINITIQPGEQNWNIPMGMMCDKMIMTFDQKITLRLNATTADAIFLDQDQSPFQVSGLKLNQAIHDLYVSTLPSQSTNISILAWGLITS